MDNSPKISVKVAGSLVTVRGKRAVSLILGGLVALLSYAGILGYKVQSLQAQVDQCQKVITGQIERSFLNARH